jgi:hypothetical protein
MLHELPAIRHLVAISVIQINYLGITILVYWLWYYPGFRHLVEVLEHVPHA